MKTLARVSPSISAVAVSVVDPRSRGSMASAGQSLPGRGSSGGRSPVVASPPERERRTGDRPFVKTQGDRNSSAERPRTRERGREIAGDDGRVLAGAEEARPAFATQNAAGRRSGAASGVRERGERAHKHYATSEFTGQNGKIYDTNPVLTVKCGGKGSKHKRAAGSKRRVSR
jgi:hypothetical protein